MTSFVDRILGRTPAVKATMGGSWLAAYEQGGIPLSYLNSDPQDKAARLLKAYGVDWFNKAERKISTDFAGLELNLAPEDEEGDNQQDEVEADLLTPWATLDPIEQFLRLMEKPNENYTGRQLRQKTMIWLDMAGWGFWYTELGSDGLVVENGIYGISPTRLWPSYDKSGSLIGWVMDKNKQGGGIPFDVAEIVPFSYGSSDEGFTYGMGVVEPVWAQVPLTDLFARHTADVMQTGGRLAGAMWPKNRALDEAEFEDAKRAWRNVASDPNAGRRLLIFPEPMEWSQSASTPAEIGIPELANLNRDDILTAFPISPYQLGVPMPGGLNSAETRKEDRRDYWQGTIHPRVELFEETIQSYLVPKYEKVVGFTLDFEVEEPNLDDAPTLIEKSGALTALINLGFDEKEAVAAVGLEHIKFNGKPEPVAPAVPGETEQAALAVTANDSSRQDAAATTVNVSKSYKAKVEEQAQAVLDPATQRAIERLNGFFIDQRSRVVQNVRRLPPTKSERRAAIKADPEWWDAQYEDEQLTTTMRGIYVDVGIGGLQAVADNLGRVVLKGFTQNIVGDLLEYGGERITAINERTLEAVTGELAEGTRRGYSITQLVEGVKEEGFKGVLGVELDNGTPAFGELRAETIARTETMLSYNRATVHGYGEFGVGYLIAHDGDHDEQCASRNGQEFTINEADGIADHPNGTLVWSPVVDKAWHEPESDRSVKVDVGSPVFNLHMPAQSYTFPEPNVTYTAPAITIEPPVNNITTPDVTILPTVVNVAAPNVEPTVVNVAAPNVTVQPPDVQVKADVTVSPEMRITSMPDRVTRREVKRDKRGVIMESTDVEVDG